MVALAYIGYGVLVLILAAVAGTAISAMKGRANPVFASPGFILTAGLVFGVSLPKIRFGSDSTRLGEL